MHPYSVLSLLPLWHLKLPHAEKEGLHRHYTSFEALRHALLRESTVLFVLFLSRVPFLAHAISEPDVTVPSEDV